MRKTAAKKIKALEDKIDALRNKQDEIRHKEWEYEEAEEKRKWMKDNAECIPFCNALVGKACTFGDSVIKHHTDKVIAELKADYKEAVDRLKTANLIKDEQKAKADKLLSCLKSLVMSDLIKECTEKASSIEMVKEYDLWNSKQKT